jgi:hypothetical protein
MSNSEWFTALNPHIVDNSESFLSNNHSTAANRNSRNRGASTHSSNRGRGRGNKTRLFFGSTFTSRQSDDSRANRNFQNRSRSRSRSRAPTFRSNNISDSVRDKTTALEDLGLNPDHDELPCSLYCSHHSVYHCHKLCSLTMPILDNRLSYFLYLT